MAEIKSVVIHCPKCLVEMEIKPTIKSISRVNVEGLFLIPKKKIIVTFEDFVVDHVCEKSKEQT